MSYITIRVFLNTKGEKTPFHIQRTLAIKIYVLRHVTTNDLEKIICRYLKRFLEMSGNEPYSKIRI